jgi:type II secretory pathway component PulJ
MRRGFTIMEILVYAAVLSVIFLSVYGFLTWAVRSNDRIMAMREAADNTRRVLETLTHEIREADSVYGPTSTSTQLSLETKHYLPAGETSSFIDFYLCGETASAICFKKESQNPVAVTSADVKVNKLEFLQISTTTPSIRIRLQIDSMNTTSTISLRNY